MVPPASVDADGNFHLSSKGARFGDAGFYRMQRIDADRLRVWRISTLLEDFRVYVDGEGVLRCDHAGAVSRAADSASPLPHRAQTRHRLGVEPFVRG